MQNHIKKFEYGILKGD